MPFAVVCTLLSRFFSSVTTKRASVRIKYRRTQLKAAGALRALLGKELRRFASNSMIILNSALGSIFLVIMGVAALIYREDLLQVLGLMPGEGMLAGMAVLALSFMGAMDYISAAAVSLEGKSLWIPKTIPVPVRTILMAKVLLNVVIALPLSLIHIFRASKGAGGADEAERRGEDGGDDEAPAAPRYGQDAGLQLALAGAYGAAGAQQLRRAGLHGHGDERLAVGDACLLYTSRCV